MKFVDGKLSADHIALISSHIYIAFFRTFNSTFPLYNQDLFQEKYARMLFPTPESDTVWYASLDLRLMSPA